MIPLVIRFKGEGPISVPVFVKKNLLFEIPPFLKMKKFGFEYVIITDEKVKKLFGLKLFETCKKAGLKISLLSVPPGEKTKNLNVVKGILEKMASTGLKRDGCVLGLGGGVIGDLAGFVASIYMRGIAFIHIPTTLLAMIDSGLGGKTGVDLGAGKNLVGTFHQPRAILVDPVVLTSLSQSEFRNGLAEMVKHAVVASPQLFLTLEKFHGKILNKEPALLEKLIEENIRIKKRVVEVDPLESMKKTTLAPRSVSRMFLNYGHTIGHAIEKVTNYEISHGEAVSIGMCMENIMAVKKGFLKPETALRIRELLKILGLPTKLPASVSLQSLDRALRSDKKMVGGKIYFALPTKIGKMKLFAL